MNLELSQKAEKTLKRDILALISDFLKSYTKPKPRILGLITPTQLKEELDISAKTLRRWEANGLRRYQPPLEENKKVFYKVSDILVFLGVDDGR